MAILPPIHAFWHYGCFDEAGTVWWYINIIVEGREEEDEEEGLTHCIQSIFPLTTEKLLEIFSRINEENSYLFKIKIKANQPHPSDSNLRVIRR